ncbi:MAG: 50S ribosomal protein L9 [Candidatus Binatia bacterium]
MQVILQQDVDNLGTIGEVVKVKPGYARNYLLPRGLALEADARNLAMLEHRKRQLAAKRAKIQKTNEVAASRLAGVQVTIHARAGEEGKLFGSVTNQDIQRALALQGFDFDRKKILLDTPIKALGDHTVVVNLGAGVRSSIKVSVIGDRTDAGAPPAEEPAAADEVAGEES